MNPFNPEQQKAVEAPSRPLLIVAGAGTGKTHTLTGRLLHLIASGVPPHEICAITFTNKAAREMGERLAHRLAKPRVTQGPQHRSFSWIDNGGPYIGTFHALGVQILRKEAPLFGRSKNFVIFDDNDSWSLVKKVWKAVDGKDEGITPSQIGDAVSHFKNRMVTLKEVEKSDQGELLLRAYEMYEKKLVDNNAFDFDDLVHAVVRLFEEHPAVLQKYQRRFSHVLVDEYQDINNIQYDFIRLLAGEKNQVSVVGDENQTIYTWRGSNIKLFLGFRDTWPEAQVVVLNTNYRSTQTIVNAASSLIRFNSERLAKEERALTSAGEVGTPIILREAQSETQEAEWVGSLIYNLVRQEPEKSVAVLYRTNAQSRGIEQELLRRRIPYRVFGGLRFYERLEIRDIVAGLRFAYNRQDEASKTRLEKNLTKKRFRDFEAALAEKTPDSPAELITLFLRTTEYLTILDRSFTNFSEREENIKELLEFAQTFTEMGSFLEQITLIQSTDSVTNETEHITPVTLTTIHLAKGLEFDTVFVVGCAEGLLPHSRSFDSPQGLEEERRLMYVAMTRARSKLFLSFYDLPSRFLSEISSDYMEFTSETGNEKSLDDEERYITWD